MVVGDRYSYQPNPTNPAHKRLGIHPHYKEGGVPVTVTVTDTVAHPSLKDYGDCVQIQLDNKSFWWVTRDQLVQEANPW